MKVNFKKIGVEVEANAESLIEKGINSRENDWKEKLESKTKNKKAKKLVKKCQCLFQWDRRHSVFRSL